MNERILNICFIRHGETDENLKRHVQGRKDFPLNDNGKMQAHQVAKALKNMNYQFDAIYSSPLSRAYETALIINNDLELNLNIKKEFAFIERDFGIYEGMEVSKENFDPILKNVGQGLETSDEIEDRVSSGIYEIINNTKYQNVLIVAHSHTIKALIAYLDKNYSYYNPMVNCAINNFKYENNELKIVEYNIDPKKIVS